MKEKEVFQCDLDILTEMMEDYEMTPEDTLADFLEAVKEAEKEAENEEET